jgi:hypothetical protein
MYLNRDLADAQLLGDLFVEQAAGHECEYFSLALGQALIPRAQLTALLVLGPCTARLSQSVLKRTYELNGVTWQRQEVNGARLDGSDA